MADIKYEEIGFKACMPIPSFGPSSAQGLINRLDLLQRVWQTGIEFAGWK